MKKVLLLCLLHLLHFKSRYSCGKKCSRLKKCRLLHTYYNLLHFFDIFEKLHSTNIISINYRRSIRSTQKVLSVLNIQYFKNYCIQ